ncbi:class I SAM-dependent methyltransferase [Kocuria sp. NPDC057446]|uniref:class I SAM-dependent methyltransferase n=1 Tax=Kocuria sp. NPDC057446 TaxID=3346137 RepID=UPI0036B0784A
MDDNQRMWEDRYASGASSPDGAQPHPEVAALLERTAGERADGPPSALDLGAGTGRHTLALAAAGYDPTAVDFSPSAVRSIAGALAEHGLPGRALVADLRTWTPEQEQRSGPDAVPPRFDLIVAVYFQHDLSLLRRAAEWLVPGGRLLWLTHAPGSVEGPPPAVPRPSLQETVAVLEGKGLDLLRAQQVRTSEAALDVVLEAVRPR